jgi:hypothetical protein
MWKFCRPCTLNEFDITSRFCVNSVDRELLPVRWSYLYNYRHQATKTYKGMETKPHAFFIVSSEAYLAILMLRPHNHRGNIYRYALLWRWWCMLWAERNSGVNGPPATQPSDMKCSSTPHPPLPPSELMTIIIREIKPIFWWQQASFRLQDMIQGYLLDYKNDPEREGYVIWVIHEIKYHGALVFV